MKKLPYFPFYYLDWLSSSSVSMMTHEEKGLFIDMLCRCYNDGGLPNDRDKLQRLFNCGLESLSTVSCMFYSVDGLLKNKKLDKIISEQKKLINSKSQAGKASAKARADKKLQFATGVEQVLKSVATEVQRNSTNKTKQNKTKQNKELKSKPKNDEPLTVSISIDPAETTKPKPGAFEQFFEYFPKKFNPMCPNVKGAFWQAVSIAGSEDEVLSKAAMYADYFTVTEQPLQYATKAQEWLDSQQWRTDWPDETKRFKDRNGKKGLSNSKPSVIKKGDVF